jgi:hypothetical protein
MTHYRKASCDVVPITDHDDIIEAAARAIWDNANSPPLYPWDERSTDKSYYLNLATAILTAVTPLIRAAALEEAEQAIRQCSCLDKNGNILATRSVIAAIRALKEQP